MPSSRRLPFRRPTPSIPASSPHSSVPHSIRSSSDLLVDWDRLSMHVEWLILVHPTIGRDLIDSFATTLKQLDTITKRVRTGDLT